MVSVYLLLDFRRFRRLLFSLYAGLSVPVVKFMARTFTSVPRWQRGARRR